MLELLVPVSAEPGSVRSLPQRIEDRPRMGCSPGMPSRLFSLPRLSGSRGSLRFEESLNPMSRSFTTAVPMIRFQFTAKPQKGLSEADANDKGITVSEVLATPACQE